MLLSCEGVCAWSACLYFALLLWHMYSVQLALHCITVMVYTISQNSLCMLDTHSLWLIAVCYIIITMGCPN